MSRNLKIVLDTNVLLVSISSRSKYHWVFQKLLHGKFELVVTNEILMEYEEVIAAKFSVAVARNVIRTLLLLPNVTRSEVYYNWLLIKDDADDNKFVDCAVAANANYIVTNDRHFGILSEIDFPAVATLNINQFKEMFET